MVSDPTQSRLDTARHLADIYRHLPTVEALFVAGSVARGTADVGSDLEIDILWREPPSDRDRRYAMDITSAHIDFIAEYEDDEWSERYHLNGLQVDISGFLTRNVRQYIDEVTVRCNPAPERQWLLSALQDGLPLSGDRLLRELLGRLIYPDALARAVIAQGLDFEALWYYQRLADRHDSIMLHQVFARAELSLMTCLCGLNRLYLPHPDFKWAQPLVDRMAHVPRRLLLRLESAFSADPKQGLGIFQSLALETSELIQEEWPDLVQNFLAITNR